METMIRSRLTEPVDRSAPFEGNFTRSSTSEILLADVLSPPPVAPSIDPEDNSKLFAVLCYERAEVFEQLAVSDDPYVRILLLQEEESLSALQTAAKPGESANMSFHQLLACQTIAQPVADHADISLLEGNPLVALQAGSDAHQETAHAAPTRSTGLNTSGLPDPFLKPTIGRGANRVPANVLDASFGLFDELLPTVPNLVPDFKLPAESTDPDTDERTQITDDASGLKSIPRPQRAIDKVMQDYREQGLTVDVDREFISAIRISDAEWDAFAGQPKVDELLRQLRNGQNMTIVERRTVHSKLLSEFEKSSRPVIIRIDYADALQEAHKSDEAKVQYMDAYSKSVVLPVNQMRQEISQIDRDLKLANLKAEDKNDLTRMRGIIAGTGRADGLVDLPGSAMSKIRR